MKFFIPPLGTRLKLIEPWTFTLYDERRNNLWKTVTDRKQNWSYNRWNQCESASITVSLEPGTILSVSRIYIRLGIKSFDSITFNCIKTAKNKPHGRFWVKLADANKIVFELTE